MNPWENNGDLVHLELDSNDATTAAALVAYWPATGAVRTIDSDEQIYIEDYAAANNHSAAMELDLFCDYAVDGSVAAGERIMPTYLAEANGGGVKGSFRTGRPLKVGAVPKAKASLVGPVCFVCDGYVRKVIS